jgi:hypothetical protein
MSHLAQIEIDRDVADAAARRAAEEGVTVAAYISQLLRRSFERAPGEEAFSFTILSMKVAKSISTVSPTRTTRPIAAALLFTAACLAATVDASSRRLRHLQFSLSWDQGTGAFISRGVVRCDWP